jgi:hypothetical protein
MPRIGAISRPLFGVVKTSCCNSRESARQPDRYCLVGNGIHAHHAMGVPVSVATRCRRDCTWLFRHCCQHLPEFAIQR